MKILFISSGNIQHSDVSPFIKAQGESLKALGHEVDYYPIRGKGILGYLRNVGPLRKVIQENGFQVLHAHYSLSGIVAFLASRQSSVRRRQCAYSEHGRKKSGVRPAIIVSLLGSDVNGQGYKPFLLRILSYTWDAIIVKSPEMISKLGLNKARLIPNGVDLAVFHEMDKTACREELKLKSEKKYILFAADPQRQVKNFPLAHASWSKLVQTSRDLDSANCELVTLGFASHKLIPKYLNACDVLLLTSLWEGSPNIVKEAMACNCSIVSTNVGDVEWLISGLEGCYLADVDPEDLARKLEDALAYQERTKGRERLINLGLDSQTVARQLLDLYNQSTIRG